MSTQGKSMVRVILIVLAISFVVGVVVFARSALFSWFCGLCLGGITSIYKVWQLNASVKKAVKLSATEVGQFAQRQALGRLLVTFLVLLVAVYVPFINLLGTAIGVLSFNVAVFFIKVKPQEKVVSN